MKTKNGEMWLGAWVHLYRWAILFELDIECYHRDYMEVNLSILCFTFNYTRASNKFLADINKA